MKTLFLHMVVHELRRPFGLARGYVAMMQDGSYGDLPEALADPVRELGASLREAGRLLEGLAGVARAEDRADFSHVEPCRVSLLLRSAVAGVKAEAEAKGVRIESRPPAEDPVVRVDGDQVKVALLNLISNAVKYSQRGSTVTVRAGSNADRVVVAVSDRGPGVKPGEAAAVFREHYRGGRQEPSMQDGLGLGLYIASKLVELHGGRVLLRPRPGGGSTFAVVLPLSPPGPTAAEATRLASHGPGDQFEVNQPMPPASRVTGGVT